ncbi:hypothetical protein E2P81_ATG00024 [Venturia nashicola]|nr:hypothetical protein E2P81_ATG00024 [Venturia nashicola]
MSLISEAPIKAHLEKIHEQNRQLTKTLNSRNIPLRTPYESELEPFPELSAQILFTGPLKTYINDLPPTHAHTIRGVSHAPAHLSPDSQESLKNYEERIQHRWCNSLSHWERRGEMHARTLDGKIGQIPPVPAKCLAWGESYRRYAEEDEKTLRRSYIEHIRPHDVWDDANLDRARREQESLWLEDHHQQQEEEEAMDDQGEDHSEDHPEEEDDQDQDYPDEYSGVEDDQAPIRHGLWDQELYDRARQGHREEFQQDDHHQAHPSQDQSPQDQKYDPTAYYDAPVQRNHYEGRIPIYLTPHEAEQYFRGQQGQAPCYPVPHPQGQHQQAPHHHQAPLSEILHQTQSTQHRATFAQWQESERKLTDELEKRSRAANQKRVQHLHEEEEREHRTVFQEWQENERRTSDELEGRSRAALRERVSHLHEADEREQRNQEQEQEQEPEQEDDDDVEDDEDEEWRRQLEHAETQQSLATPPAQSQPAEEIPHGGEHTQSNGIYQFEMLIPQNPKRKRELSCTSGPQPKQTKRKKKQ